MNFMCDMITHPNSNLNDGTIKPMLNSDLQAMVSNYNPIFYLDLL